MNDVLIILNFEKLREEYTFFRSEFNLLRTGSLNVHLIRFQMEYF